ncbi:hypothetical protein Misp04_13430 [Micromonospora sp. NBRC 101691]|nr:hypothetical protein Misp04_13430 [Micromonospora sp. NBRC 101691]
MLMPPAAASRPAGRRIRAELIRRAALRAVIALPAGLMPPAAIGLHLWVLTQPNPHHPHAGDVLMVDTTAAVSANQPLVQTVGAAWHAYRSGHYAEVPGVHRAVPAIELLDDRVDLTPQRHLPRAGTFVANPAEIIARINDFDRLVERVRNGLPVVRDTPLTSLRDAPWAEVTDLIRSGAVTVQRALSRSRSGSTDASTVVLTPADVRSGGPATGCVARSLATDWGRRSTSTTSLFRSWATGSLPGSRCLHRSEPRSDPAPS